MKISVPPLLVASENDARDFSVGAFIEVSVCRCELHTSKTQFVSQAYAARHIAIELFGEHHPLIVGEDLANPNARSDMDRAEIIQALGKEPDLLLLTSDPTSGIL